MRGSFYYHGDSREPSGATDTTTAGVYVVLDTTQVSYQNHIRLQCHTMKINPKRISSVLYYCLSSACLSARSKTTREKGVTRKIKLNYVPPSNIYALRQTHDGNTVVERGANTYTPFTIEYN